MYEILATLAFAVFLAAHFMALVALRPLGHSPVAPRTARPAAAAERAPALSAHAARS